MTMMQQTIGPKSSCDCGRETCSSTCCSSAVSSVDACPEEEETATFVISCRAYGKTRSACHLICCKNQSPASCHCSPVKTAADAQLIGKTTKVSIERTRIPRTAPRCRLGKSYDLLLWLYSLMYLDPYSFRRWMLLFCLYGLRAQESLEGTFV